MHKVLAVYITTGPTKAPANALIHFTGAQGTPHWWAVGVVIALLGAVLIAFATRKTAR
jgi:hypothetical protein